MTFDDVFDEKTVVFLGRTWYYDSDIIYNEIYRE